MPYIIVDGDVLEAKEPLMHQCNCVTRSAAGIASDIFKKYPQANCYVNRWQPSKPGTIATYTADDRVIINAMAQYYPGGPRKNDTLKMRREWFIACLNAIPLEHYPIAVPYGIGCGMARGKWEEYLALLNDAPGLIYVYRRKLVQ